MLKIHTFEMQSYIDSKDKMMWVFERLKAFSLNRYKENLTRDLDIMGLRGVE